MATRPTLERGVALGNITASMFNDNFDDTLDYVSAVDTEKSASITSLQSDMAIVKNMPLITLSGTTPSLTNNRVHSITISANTTFTLPSADSTKLNQILVLVSMPTAYTITLGTTTYFYNSAPDMSTAGNYTLIYEYDGSNWVVGAMYKGA